MVFLQDFYPKNLNLKIFCRGALRATSSRGGQYLNLNLTFWWPIARLPSSQRGQLARILVKCQSEILIRPYICFYLRRLRVLIFFNSKIVNQKYQQLEFA